MTRSFCQIKLWQLLLLQATIAVPLAVSSHIYQIASAESKAIASIEESGGQVGTQSTSVFGFTVRVCSYASFYEVAVDSRHIDAVKLARGLRYISMSKCRCDSQFVLQNALLPRLENIEFKECQIADGAFRSLSASNSLRRVSLVDCEISPEEVLAICQAPCLEELEIWGVPADDRILKCLSLSKHFKVLSIDDNTCISDSSLAIFEKCRPDVRID